MHTMLQVYQKALTIHPTRMTQLIHEEAGVYIKKFKVPTNDTVDERRQRFIRTARSLHTILTQKLYQMVASSLDDYAKTRWDISGTYIYRLAYCVPVFEALDGIPDPDLPHCERLCRMLLQRCSSPHDIRTLWNATLAFQSTQNKSEITGRMLATVHRQTLQQQPQPNMAIEQCPPNMDETRRNPLTLEQLALAQIPLAPSAQTLVDMIEHTSILEWWKQKSLAAQSRGVEGSPLLFTYSEYAIDSLCDHVDSHRADTSEDHILEMLNWWHHSGFPLKYTALAMDEASANGYTRVLEWWKQSGHPLKYTDWALTGASESGYVDSLDWWMRSGLSLDIHVKDIARCICDGMHGEGSLKDVAQWWKMSGLINQAVLAKLEENSSSVVVVRVASPTLTVSSLCNSVPYSPYSSVLSPFSSFSSPPASPRNNDEFSSGFSSGYDMEMME